MPRFTESSVETFKQISFTMKESPKNIPDEKPLLTFVSEKASHDCILHAVRDQRANAFWQAVEGMAIAVADTMPMAFIPFTTRSPSGYAQDNVGWGGRWPSGMVGVSFAEAEQVMAFAKSFPEWEDDYPAIVSRVLKK